MFRKLEKVSDLNSDPIEKEIQARIDTITSICERLDIMVYKEPLTRRTNSKYRVDQVKYDKDHLQAALDTYKNRKYQRLQEEREREALLSHQFKLNNYEETAILMDHSQSFYSSKHHDSLKMICCNQEREYSRVLKDQRMTLKGAHRRLYDIANTLGLSNTTMRLIERRAYQDRFILIGGIVFTCLVIAAIIYYFT
ncbi:hypothetical protein L9F63_028393 [Diploptera punctata]|uniref:Golgi SNAP receptor complex member 2 n=1 Tax=Diploptera punctata TaxID=6984 RepID=A0AAD7ZTE1_DIPPU|nr:hypothetical protein L9F63_028393 [Diploptera punctata]